MFDCHGTIKHVLMNIYCQECPLFSAGLPDPFSALPFSMAQETDSTDLSSSRFPGPQASSCCIQPMGDAAGGTGERSLSNNSPPTPSASVWSWQ